MTTRTFHADGSQPQPGEVFVFGSNQAGYHGGGGARAAATQYGAEFGVSEGLTGQSYAIPTCDADIAPLFTAAPLNCSLPDTWAPIFKD